jgi:hypothetical protein
MAKRIIAYKQKISEQWLEKNEKIQNKDESEESTKDEDKHEPKKEMVLTKNKKMNSLKKFYQFILCLIKLNINY